LRRHRLRRRTCGRAAGRLGAHRPALSPRVTFLLFSLWLPWLLWPFVAVAVAVAAIAAMCRHLRQLRRLYQSGMLPCFFGGSVARLVRSVRSARATKARVWAGSITEST